MIQETAEFVRAGSAEGVSVRIAFVSNNIVRAIIAYVVLTFAVFELAVGQHHHATAPTKPAVLMTGLGNVHHTRAMWHYARGVAFAATGKTDQAKQEQKLFGDTVKTIPAETPYDLNSAAEVLQVAARVLDARIAWGGAGDRAKAIESWRGAVAAQDALNYAEPPDWYYPVRESLAAALFLIGDATGAEKIFREDLKNNPRNGRSLFGLMESLKKQGKQDAARWIEGEFKAAWKKAEVQLKMKDL